MEAEQGNLLPDRAGTAEAAAGPIAREGSAPPAQRINEIRKAMAALEKECTNVRPRVFWINGLASANWLLYFGLILVLPMYSMRSFQPPLSLALFIPLLLLAYLKGGRKGSPETTQLLDKITGDTGHSFYPKAVELKRELGSFWSGWSR